MSEETTATDARIQPGGLSATGPLLVWVLIQMASLVVAGARLPLAAKYPRPEESLAAYVMLVAQVVGSGLLFPYLMRDWRTAAITIAAAWPFLLLAAGIAAVPAGDASRAAGYVTAWLIALALWRTALPGPRSLAIATAIWGLLTVGAATVWYLQSEFVTEGDNDLTWLSPLVASVRQLTSARVRGAEWALPSGLCAAALLAGFAGRVMRRRRRRQIPTDASGDAM